MVVDFRTDRRARRREYGSVLRRQDLVGAVAEIIYILIVSLDQLEPSKP